MVKALLLLVAVLLISGTAYWKYRTPTSDKVTVTTGDVLPQQANPETLGASTSTLLPNDSWKTYENKDFRMRLRYPQYMDIQKEAEDLLNLSGGQINIKFFKKDLSDKDTVNTVAEEVINQKIGKLGDKFELIDSISPIAIGQITGVTFTTKESDKVYTYYLVPLEKSFLTIEDTTEVDQVSVSDTIIYSLEIL